MVIASMLTTIADVTYDEYKAAYERIFTRSGIDYKAIIGDGGAMAEKDSQEFMAVTPARTDLDRWVVLDKSVASFDEIPASPRRNQSRIAQMDGLW